MAAAISPGLGKTCAQKNKQNKQKNGGIIAQQMAGREAQDVLLQTLNAAIFDACPLLPPLLSSRGDWEGLEPAGFGMGHTRELTRDVICIFMGIRTPKLQSAHLRLKDAQGKDSRAPRQSPRGEGRRRGEKSSVAVPGATRAPLSAGPLGRRKAQTGEGSLCPFPFLARTARIRLLVLPAVPTAGVVIPKSHPSAEQSPCVPVSAGTGTWSRNGRVQQGLDFCVPSSDWV